MNVAIITQDGTFVVRTHCTGCNLRSGLQDHQAAWPCVMVCMILQLLSMMRSLQLPTGKRTGP